MSAHGKDSGKSLTGCLVAALIHSARSNYSITAKQVLGSDRTFVNKLYVNRSKTCIRYELVCL